MGLSIVIKCVKYLLFIFNFIFFLVGAAVFAVALWLRFSNQTQTLFNLEGHGSTFYTGINILIVVGALIMVVTFLGCCGAFRESQWMLVLYFLCLLVIFVMVIAAGIFGSAKRDQVLTELQTFYSETYAKYLATGQESLKQTLKALHSTLTCCGLTGVMEEAISGTCPAPDANRSAKSCPAAIDEFVNSKFQIVTAVLIVIGIVLVFCMILSKVLCCAIWRRPERI